MASPSGPTQPGLATFPSLAITTEWPLHSTLVVAPRHPRAATLDRPHSRVGALRRAVSQVALGLALSDPMVNGAYRTHMAEIARDGE
jgi:hypothetical protein